MIVILKREDLAPELRQLAVEDLRLEHFELSAEVIEHAELIAFAEDSAVKFLRHRHDIQSKESLGILVGYITSPTPVTKMRPPWSKPRWRKGNKENEHRSLVGIPCTPAPSQINTNTNNSGSTIRTSPRTSAFGGHLMVKS